MGTNSVVSRWLNGRAILKELRRLGQGSKVALVRRFNLTQNTAGQNVGSLEQQSLISTIGKDTDHRRCTLLSLRARRDFATAYDGSVVRGAGIVFTIAFGMIDVTGLRDIRRESGRF
jgi:hypothetical protein